MEFGTLSCATPRYFLVGSSSESSEAEGVEKVAAEDEVVGVDVCRALEALAVVLTDVGETGCAKA
jgi:hypothetical protein